MKQNCWAGYRTNFLQQCITSLLVLCLVFLFFPQELSAKSSLEQFIIGEIESTQSLSIKTLYNNAIANGYETDLDSIQNLIETYIDSQDQEDIYSKDTGFITTYGMLNKPLDHITFGATHNAFSNNEDAAEFSYNSSTKIGTQNHHLGIRKQLELGYRVIDLDIGNKPNGKTSAFHRVYLAGTTDLISSDGKSGICQIFRDFLADHPDEILIVHMSDVYNKTFGNVKKGESLYYSKMNDLMKGFKNAGVLHQIYNYMGSQDVDDNDLYNHMGVLTEDIPMPTIKDLLMTDKRIVFLERDTYIGTWLDFAENSDDPYMSNENNINISAEQLQRLNDPNDQGNTLVNLHMSKDWGAAAGNYQASLINNEGRHVYKVLSEFNRQLESTDKVINALHLDFVQGDYQEGGVGDVTAMDAINRINYDHLGYDWGEHLGELYWPDYYYGSKSYLVGGLIKGGQPYTIDQVDGSYPVKIEISGDASREFGNIHQGSITSFTATYSDARTLHVGKGVSNRKILILQPGDYIRKVEMSGLEELNYLKITTAFGDVITNGTPSLDVREFEAPEGYHISGFYGNSGDRVDSMGLYVSPIPNESNTTYYGPVYGGIGGNTYHINHDAAPVKFTLRGGERVDQISITYDDGTQQVAGGNGGSPREMILKPDEYVNKVAIRGNGDRVLYMKLTTNLGQSIEAGTYGSGTVVWEDNNHYVSGFHGRSGDEIDNLGLIYKPLSELSFTAHFSDTLGGNGGHEFLMYDTSAISDIGINSNKRLDQLRVRYANNVSSSAGGTGGHDSNLYLAQDEYIASVTVSSNGKTIHYIKLTTDKGNILEGGIPSEHTKTFNAPSGSYISGFHGRCGSEVDKLGVIYRPLP